MSTRTSPLSSPPQCTPSSPDTIAQTGIGTANASSLASPQSSSNTEEPPPRLQQAVTSSPDLDWLRDRTADYAAAYVTSLQDAMMPTPISLDGDGYPQNVRICERCYLLDMKCVPGPFRLGQTTPRCQGCAAADEDCNVGGRLPARDHPDFAGAQRRLVARYTAPGWWDPRPLTETEAAGALAIPLDNDPQAADEEAIQAGKIEETAAIVGSQGNDDAATSEDQTTDRDEHHSSEREEYYSSDKAEYRTSDEDEYQSSDRHYDDYSSEKNYYSSSDRYYHNE